ncbi:MAG: hypothetical protein M0Z60_03720 [Nitrospiraceae bacterium]|nr:hypothetical protein [Nitrospiraceae bacterium]
MLRNLSAEPKGGGRRGICLAAVLLPGLLVAGLSYGDQKVSLWERMCEACHDGKTVLNGKVVIDKRRIKEKYRTIDDLVKGVTCQGAPCMNILKHDKKLVGEVGEEIGIPESRPQ